MDLTIGKSYDIPGDKFPPTKVKNVSCVRCKHCFGVKDFSRLRGVRIPFILECGHPVCYGCIETGLPKCCPACKHVFSLNDHQKVSCTVNVYALGLLLAASKRTLQAQEPDVSFQQSLNSRPRQMHHQGQCYECGVRATIKCPQCAVLYCSMCYAKMHGRALQSHQKILLSAEKHHVLTIRNPCSDTCDESPGYYCTVCELACCSHCMLRCHANHSYVSLQKKNEELMPNFYIEYDKVAECFNRIQQAQKKVRSVSTFPAELQNSEAVETAISEHFAYLHGVLQNTEKRLIDEIRHQQNRLGRKLDELTSQLRAQEDQLQAALLMAASAKENCDNVDIQKVIRKLEELADLPCHLVQEPVSKDDKIELKIDRTIVEAIENHCTIQVPAISGLNLKPTSGLPEDYEMEPLTQEIKIPKSMCNTPTSPPKPVVQTVSIVSPKVETVPGSLTKGTGTHVTVTHIVDPLCFYVQKLYKREELEELQKQLDQYGKASTSVVPSEVIQNKLYVIQRKRDKQWCRGRVTKIYTDSNNQEKYKVFYVDDGTEESGISMKYMREVNTEISGQPVMATKCSLHDIAPRDGKWKRQAIKAFREMVTPNDDDLLKVSISMHISTIQGSTHYVDLIVDRPGERGSPASLRQTLVFKGFAAFHSFDNLMRMNPQSMPQFYTETLELQKYVIVDVQLVVSPEEIYVTKTENSHYLKKLLKDMADYYGKKTGPEEVVFVPHKNMPCAVEDTNGAWNRGIISDADVGGVKVFLVDVGSSLTRQHSALRVLSPKYLKTPTQAIKISLKNIQPLPADAGRWNRLTIQFLKRHLSNKVNATIFPFEKIKNTYSCHLFVGDNVDFSNKLVGALLAERIGTGSKRYSSCPLPSLLPASQPEEKTKPKVHKKKIRQEEKRFPNSSYNSMDSMDPLSVSKDEPDAFKIGVHVHRIISPDCIYVSEVTRVQSNAKMTASMQEFYNKYRSKVQVVWEEGAVYAVYSAKDKAYFRARILTLKSTNEAVVFFYDLGIEEVVNLKNIQTLHPQFLKIPAYLFKVKLAGILPCGGSTAWPSLSCERLQDIVNDNQNCKFYISKAEETSDGAIPVELWVKQSKTEGPLTPTKVEINCINRMLVENGVALPIKGYAQMKDKILAIELKRELNETSTVTDIKANDTWFSLEDIHTSELDSMDQRTMEAESDISSADGTKSESDLSEYVEGSEISEFSVWKPPEPIIEDEFKALPTYVDHDCAIYLHSIEQNGKTLQLIESKLHEQFRKQKLRTCDMAWKEGDICIAQYHYNKKWYRGKVIKLLQNDMVQVEFVDYGNIEDCEIGTLLKRIVLHDIPIQCTKCIIHGLRPDTPDRKWSIMDLDLIHAILVEKECKITVLAREATHLVVSIRLFQPKDCDLVTYLMNDMKMKVKFCLNDISDTDTHSEEKLASSPDVLIEKYVTHPNENYEERSDTLTCSDLSLDAQQYNDANISSDSVQIQEHNIDCSDTVTTDFDSLSWIGLPGRSKLVSSTPFNESVENLSSRYIPLKIPSDQDTLKVELCFIHRPTLYYIQLREDDEATIFGNVRNRYNQMMIELQKNAAAQPLIETLASNTPCCAKFQDGLWYRCLIKECFSNPLTDDLEITLSYVDFGNKEARTLDRNNHNLRVLKEEWLNIPVMAIKCWLWNVEVLCDMDHYDVLIPRLHQIFGVPLTAKVKKIQGNILWVDLFRDKNCTKLAYASLIKDGLLGIKKIRD